MVFLSINQGDRGAVYRIFSADQDPLQLPMSVVVSARQPRQTDLLHPQRSRPDVVVGDGNDVTTERSGTSGRVCERRRRGDDVDLDAVDDRRDADRRPRRPVPGLSHLGVFEMNTE